MRPLLLVVLALATAPGAATALPPPDPSFIPDAFVPLLHCGHVHERTVRWEPDPDHPWAPPPQQRAWKNVTIHLDPDRCAAPAGDGCTESGVACCEAAPPYEPCRPAALVGGPPATKGQKGLTLPTGLGVCVTYALPNYVWVETRNCWEGPPTAP